MRCIKVLLAISELEKAGFAASDAGIRKILIGAPEALAFSDCSVYGSYSSFSSRKEKSVTRQLLSKEFIKSSFLESEEEYYFLLLEKGREALNDFLSHGYKVANRHASKKAPHAFVRKETLK